MCCNPIHSDADPYGLTQCVPGFFENPEIAGVDIGIDFDDIPHIGVESIDHTRWAVIADGHMHMGVTITAPIATGMPATVARTVVIITRDQSCELVTGCGVQCMNVRCLERGQRHALQGNCLVV
ncbi:hypothetical protein E1297_28670 [Roseibium sp. RKSG952]|nr:hypothetical protein [Roseibium sp. RKSG952]